ncbi:hypothetical protein LX36DRAFT_754632 [Colletotrichum falcatum]|nr:hypothetical protein LX36DRAFT_754632 [Colletotrichum falcatum]
MGRAVGPLRQREMRWTPRGVGHRSLHRNRPPPRPRPEPPPRAEEWRATTRAVSYKTARDGLRGGWSIGRSAGAERTTRAVDIAEPRAIWGEEGGKGKKSFTLDETSEEGRLTLNCPYMGTKNQERNITEGGGELISMPAWPCRRRRSTHFRYQLGVLGNPTFRRDLEPVPPSFKHSLSHTHTHNNVRRCLTRRDQTAAVSRGASQSFGRLASIGVDWHQLVRSPLAACLSAAADTKGLDWLVDSIIRP